VRISYEYSGQVEVVDTVWCLTRLFCPRCGTRATWASADDNPQRIVCVDCGWAFDFASKGHPDDEMAVELRSAIAKSRGVRRVLDGCLSVDLEAAPIILPALE
jgi:ribosomal protein S27AE